MSNTLTRPLCLSLIAALALCAALASTAVAQEADAGDEAPRIEIAILLDTSGSMDGLINQARNRLWAIVNDMALARRDGQMPSLRVALYEFGKQTIPAEDHHLRQIVALTDDLDMVSQELFALATNGGEEYCGAAIQHAVEQLEWTAGNHYRAIFIAGNESFAQGPIDPKVACQKAIEAGILVNTIHCGNADQGRSHGWADGADLADGQALNIDQNAAQVAIAAPQDARLAELNKEVNGTYLAFGRQGRERRALQENLDREADAAGGLAERAAAKSNDFYRNSAWDLVDALKEETVKIEDMKQEDLPEELRGKTKEEIIAHVEAKAAERAKIQEEMQALAEARRAYIAEERRKLAESGTETFDTAVRQAVREQMGARSFDFQDENKDEQPAEGGE